MVGRVLVWLGLIHAGALLVGIATAAGFGALTGAVAGTLAIALGASLAALTALSLVALRSVRRIEDVARRTVAGEAGERVPPGLLPELERAFNDLMAMLGERLAAAASERSRLEGVLNSSIDAVLAVDAEGRVTFANAAAEMLFERPHEEIVGNPFGWVLPDERAIEALRLSREEGTARSMISERPNHHFLQVVTTPITEGKEWAALAVLHDVTDVKRTEQVRRDFVANVSHELRTPMAAIKSLIETLEGGALEEPETAKDFLARANDEVDRLVQLVEELLELSRIESGEVPLADEAVDLESVIASAAARLQPRARALGVELSCEVTPGLPTIRGDERRLERALLNLLSNGLNFTPAGGRVCVRAESRDGNVEVSVSDTGAGIASDHLPRVFERFFKADRARGQGGTGLGLAIVKHTVEAHGGSVAVESEEGRGTTFVLSIPAAAEPDTPG